MADSHSDKHVGEHQHRAAHDHRGHDHHDHSGHDHEDHSGHDHEDHSGHDHEDHSGHDHSHDLRGASKRSLTIALILIGGFMMAEVVGGVLSGSLALLSDAGHMITDAASIALGIVRHEGGGPSSLGGTDLRVPSRGGAGRDAECAQPMADRCLGDVRGLSPPPGCPEIEGGLMLVIGILGLLVNVAAAWVLHRSSKHSMNVEGALRHVMADLMGSVGVVISGILIVTLNWTIIDPILSVLIAALVAHSSWSLTVKVFKVLLEGVPDHIDVYRLCSEMEDVEGVTLIHDVHVWTISSGLEALTGHVLIDPSFEGSTEDLLRKLRRIAHEDFGIDHVTIQVEETVAGCTEDHHVGHLLARSRPLG